MTRKLFFFFVSVLLTSCTVSPAEIPTATSQPTSLPSQTLASVPSATKKPTTMPTLTTTSTQVSPSPTPDFCNPTIWQENDIYLLSPELFGALHPGGPNTFNRILIDKNPTWVDFQQEDHGEMRNAGVIFHESSLGPELGMGVNPAVVLVVYGIKNDWALPVNSDLVSAVYQIRDSLFQDELEWFQEKVDLSKYPPIANGATYALYRYYNGNEQKLESWCRTYIDVYGEPSIQTSDN